MKKPKAIDVVDISISLSLATIVLAMAIKAMIWAFS